MSTQIKDQKGSLSGVGTKSESTKSASPSLDNLMSQRGVTPDAEFGDFQDYIEKLEPSLSSSVPFADIVPLRGSVHLAFGKTISREKVEERLTKVVNSTCG